MLAISGTDWGSSAIDPRALYIAYIRSKFLYGSPVFQSLLSSGRKESLSVLERKCLRLTTGCARSSPCEDLYFEANLLPLMDQFSVVDALLAEKYRRFPASDQVSALALSYSDPRSRLKGARKVAWSQRSDAILRSFGMTPARLNRSGRSSARHSSFLREPLIFFPSVSPCATGNVGKVIFNSELLEPCPADLDKIVKRDRALRTIADLRASHGFSFELWTDGSVDPSTGAGVGAWELYRESRLGRGQRVAFKKGSSASGLWSSSYRSEGVGMLEGLEAVLQLHMAGSNLRGISLLVCSDSQSQIKALATGPLLVREVLEDSIWKTLVSLVDDSVGLSKVVFQWIPAHCGVPRNESVDQYAAACLESATIRDTQDTQPIPLSGVAAVLKYKARDS